MWNANLVIWCSPIADGTLKCAAGDQQITLNNYDSPQSNIAMKDEITPNDPLENPTEGQK